MNNSELTFKFNEQEKKDASRSNEVHKNEIEVIKKRMDALETEFKRLPPTGLEVTKSIMENLVTSSMERIRLLESEIFFSNIVINSPDV
jgi:hypothetical protein